MARARSKPLSDSERETLILAIERKIKARTFRTHSEAMGYLASVWARDLDEAAYRLLAMVALEQIEPALFSWERAAGAFA